MKNADDFLAVSLRVSLEHSSRFWSKSNFCCQLHSHTHPHTHTHTLSQSRTCQGREARYWGESQHFRLARSPSARLSSPRHGCQQLNTAERQTVLSAQMHGLKLNTLSSSGMF